MVAQSFSGQHLMLVLRMCSQDLQFGKVLNQNLCTFEKPNPDAVHDQCFILGHFSLQAHLKSPIPSQLMVVAGFKDTRCTSLPLL